MQHALRERDFNTSGLEPFKNRYPQFGPDGEAKADISQKPAHDEIKRPTEGTTIYSLYLPQIEV